MCNSGGSDWDKVVASIGWVGPEEEPGEPDPEELRCGECDEEVTHDESMLCLCGEVLCTDCVVIGERVDSCKGCADRLALEYAEERAKRPHLTVIQGGLA